MVGSEKETRVIHSPRLGEVIHYIVLTDQPAPRGKKEDIFRNICFTEEISYLLFLILIKHTHSSLATRPFEKKARRRRRQESQTPVTCPATSGRQNAVPERCPFQSRPAGVCARLAAARRGSRSARCSDKGRHSQTDDEGNFCFTKDPKFIMITVCNNIIDHWSPLQQLFI